MHGHTNIKFENACALYVIFLYKLPEDGLKKIETSRSINELQSKSTF